MTNWKGVLYGNDYFIYGNDCPWCRPSSLNQYSSLKAPNIQQVSSNERRKKEDKRIKNLRFKELMKGHDTDDG